MEGTATAVATDSGGNSGSAPLTFEQAFAAETSPASGTSGQTTTPPAAEQPASAAETTPTQGDDRSPFVDRKRFDGVNDRMKAAEQWKQQYAWAEQIPQADLQRAIQIAQRAQADPVGYLQDLIAEVQAHPEHGQKLKSLAARALAARTGNAPPTMPQPDVAITDANGTVVGHTYSDKAMAARDAAIVQQVLSKVDERIAPIAQTHAEATKKAQDAADKAEGERLAGSFMKELTEMYPELAGDYKTNPKLVAVGQEVVRMLSAIPKNDRRLTEDSFVESITLRAAQKVIGPSLHATAESRVLDSLQQKAHASSSVNPGSAAPSTAKRPTSFYDTSLQWK